MYMNKSELKELIYEVMGESHRETSYTEELKAIRASLAHRDIAPRFLTGLYKQIDKAIEKEAAEVAASLNNKDSNLKENEEVQYVEYVADMSGELPFLMGTKKFEYVWAKYPNGKRDIGVYAFGEDRVYAYEFFRKMYNINEDGNKIKNPVRNGKVSDKSSKSEAATKSNNRYDGGVYVPSALRENNKETFTKKISGTVLVSDMEYDYSAKVTVNVVTTRQPHGEDYSEIDEENVDIEIGGIVPEPDETIEDKVNQAIYDQVREMNMSDFVNESYIDTTTIKAAKDWILDCAVNSEDMANIEDWMETASDTQVKKYVNRTFDGGWIGFLNSL